MLLSTMIILYSVLMTHALPTNRGVSVLTSSALPAQELPFGKTPISRSDMAELGRLAIALNTAYCPTSKRLDPHPSQTDQENAAPHVTSHQSSIIAASKNDEFQDSERKVDMSWYISHTPATQTLTLAFSSLPTVDDLLELLASSNVNSTSNDDLLVPLPSYLFPPEYQPHVFPPRIHHSYIPALETHGTSALLALLDLIESPPVPAKTGPEIFAALLSPFKKSATSVSPKPIRNVEIVGHGLGSAIGLLVAAALHLEVSTPTAQAYTSPLPPIDISATLFSLPRVGDQSFAKWVDSIVLSNPQKVRINRVTSYADTIPHVPERHLELQHPSLGEIWVDADPRVAYACRSTVIHDESDLCSASIPLPKTSLLDHEGPFGGVWLGPQSCRWLELDLTEM